VSPQFSCLHSSGPKLVGEKTISHTLSFCKFEKQKFGITVNMPESQQFTVILQKLKSVAFGKSR
jgi:hypothetical protein